jgi:hypothetical protein
LIAGVLTASRGAAIAVRTACFRCFSNYIMKLTIGRAYIYLHLRIEVSAEGVTEALEALGQAIDGILGLVALDQLQEVVHSEIRGYLMIGADFPPVGVLGGTCHHILAIQEHAHM